MGAAWLAEDSERCRVRVERTSLSLEIADVEFLSPLICFLEGVTYPLPSLTPVVNGTALFCVIAGILGVWQELSENRKVQLRNPSEVTQAHRVSC